MVFFAQRVLVVLEKLRHHRKVFVEVCSFFRVGKLFLDVKTFVAKINSPDILLSAKLLQTCFKGNQLITKKQLVGIPTVDFFLPFSRCYRGKVRFWEGGEIAVFIFGKLSVGQNQTAHRKHRQKYAKHQCHRNFFHIFSPVFLYANSKRGRLIKVGFS